MKKLTGSQKKHLRGLAHSMKPVVFVGQKKLAGNVINAVNESLASHELIKIKCVDFKEKDQKKEIAAEIERSAGCELVGMIGHMLIFFKQHPDAEKRTIVLPAP